MDSMTTTMTPTAIPTESLPLWMRRARRGLDWGLLLVMSLGLLAGWAFVLQPGIPYANASLNHAYMAADFADALREGRLYPRWSPHALAGYGAPIPHYYPPGAPYGVAVIEVLFTNDTQTALRIAWLLALWGAGVSVYGFVTRWMGAPYGLLAALLYQFSPCIGLTTPLALGDLPGGMALALLPLLLWAASRLLTRQRPGDFMLTALLLAALILTEPRYAVAGVLLTALLAAWACAGAARKRAAAWALGWLLLAGVLALALSAFFWLPALLERDLVSWYLPDVAPQPRLATLTDLIAPLRQIDRAELLPTPQFTLGGVLLIFGAGGLVGAWLQPSGLPRLFMPAGALLVGLLALWPGQTWLVGLLTLCAAVVGAASLALVRALAARLPGRLLARLAGRLALPGLCAVILAGSSPVWLATHWPDASDDLSPLGALRYWLDGYGVPVLPADWPTPVTIPPDLAISRFLLTGYQTGSIRRFPPELVPGDMAVGNIEDDFIDRRYPIRPEQGTHGGRFAITAQRRAELRMLLAYFPGWQAAISGKPIPLERDPATSLIVLRVPATPTWEELTVYLGETRVRLAAWLLSGGALALLLLLSRAWLKRQPHPLVFDDHRLLTLAEARLVGLALTCFGVILALTAPPDAPLQLRTGRYAGLEGASELRAQTADGLEVLGYRLDQTRYRAGDRLRFTVYWRALRGLPDNTRVVAHLYDINRRARWAFMPPRHPGGVPTRRWLLGRYVSDHHALTLPSNLLPGSYRIALEVYTCGDDNAATCNVRRDQRFIVGAAQPAQRVLLLPDVLTILD